MDNTKLSSFESIWYMCKVCKICLEKYEAMEDHFANNHDDGDFPDDEKELNTNNQTNPEESIPAPDVKPIISTADTQSKKQRKSPKINGMHRKKVSYWQNTNADNGQQKQQRNLKKKKSSKFTCEKCLSVLSSKGNLAIHMKTHTGVRPYKCNLCPKSFTHATSLNNHLRIHTGDRPFKCKFCSKRFTQVTGLNHHERIHTGEMPYKCENCGKKFAQIANWSSHVRNHHLV